MKAEMAELLRKQRSKGQCINALHYLALLTFSLSSQVFAGNLAAVTATSTDTASHRAMNVLDRNPATAWCTDDAEDAELFFIFKRKQKIDKLVITPFLEHEQSAAWLKVSDGFQSLRFPLDRSIRELEFPSAMVTDTLRMSLEGEAPDGEPSPSLLGKGFCIAEVGLWHGKRNLSRHLGRKELAKHRHRDPILGKWNGGDLGAPEKVMVFSADGTWFFAFKPLYEGRPKRMSGQFRFRGNRLLMRRGESGRWADVNLRKATVTIDAEAVGSPIQNYSTFKLNGNIDELLAGQYNNARF